MDESIPPIIYIYEELEEILENPELKEKLFATIQKEQANRFPKSSVKHVPIAPGTEMTHLTLIIASLELLSYDLGLQ